jgi:AdoMet-dependent rRNA methyltransferase SPB1
MPAGSTIIGVDLVPIKGVPNCQTFADDITTPRCVP